MTFLLTWTGVGLLSLGFWTALSISLADIVK